MAKQALGADAAENPARLGSTLPDRDFAPAMAARLSPRPHVTATRGVRR